MLTPIQFAQVAEAAWPTAANVFTAVTSSHTRGRGACTTYSAKYSAFGFLEFFTGRGACPFRAVAEALAAAAKAGAFERGEYSVAASRLAKEEEAFANAPAHV